METVRFINNFFDVLNMTSKDVKRANKDASSVDFRITILRYVKRTQKVNYKKTKLDEQGT